MQQFPEALTIAGIDSDGGGGMPIDLKTMMAMHVYGLSVITTTVAANSYGIIDSHRLPNRFIENEFKALTADYDIKACKTGLLDSKELIDLVADNYEHHDLGPLVVDPVILAKTGEVLLDSAAIKALKERLIPIATIITPNYYEAEQLTGITITDQSGMLKAARHLMKLGCSNVMIKGRHDRDGEAQPQVNDLVMLSSGDYFWLTGPYFKTQRKNGTGDALSAAITAGLAKGQSVEQSVRAAKQYVDQAIQNEIIVGHKYGPINNWAGSEKG
ncbi:bifunctional hydroxymethylpyrimidine kinase/phosphomethylpyrimidine kinase [Lactobacillus sp. Sy-1]|uniref:bifunctional hydroxymethylpyrimidine kinase/phosphomethylpyrimidine kinase n=1 Tax=Lactobacillus sp. Sy-1 TaxID=2109645 RepID=UPI001C5BF6A6|nr:bifunctional hydroxymethylpyrimidine kinase/phosphomethylpyrimidine kinase [Lactobacillus sp. Sy-1]MBW1606287.1 bifunctional hydroxymethylpyrimidine kinase/phosphomethylpyrimidine kinase [Lactobacillus sp. Sy-1]